MSDLAGANGAIPLDRLTTLPAELLKIIFDHVRELNGPTRLNGAICKSLLPFTRANLFECVRITSWKQFASLIDSVLSFGVGKFIGCLYITMDSVYDMCECHAHKVIEDRDEFLQPQRKLQAFLENLTRLCKLEVDNAFEVLEAILDYDWSEEMHLPKLRYLDVCDEFSAWENPFDPSHWENLNSYTFHEDGLFWLDINLRDRDPTTISEVVFSEGRPNSNALEILVANLTLRDFYGLPSACKFVAAFSDLFGLHLVDSSGVYTNLEHMLESVPSDLYRLSVENQHGDHGDWIDSRDLDKFTELIAFDLAGPIELG